MEDKEEVKDCPLCGRVMKFERVDWIDPWDKVHHGFYAWCTFCYREWRKK